MNESEKQFSFTRAALSTCGRAKSKFLSVQVNVSLLMRSWLLKGAFLLTVGFCVVESSAAEAKKQGTTPETWTQELPKWAMGPFDKRDEPILRPHSESKFFCPMSKKIVHWENLNAFNPGAVVKNGKVFLLYRGDEGERLAEPARPCRTGIAWSEDGIHFERYPVPVLYPDNDICKEYEWTCGVQDIHITEGPDGVYYANYSTWTGSRDYLCVATSTDLFNWKKHGRAFANSENPTTIGPERTGVVITELVDGRMLAKKIRGKYWMYYTHPSALASSDDLIHWKPHNHGVKFKVNPHHSHESGAVALYRDDGILLMFNGGFDDWKNGWQLGQALVSKDDLLTPVAELEHDFFHAEKPWELKGYLDFTTVSNALVYFQGKWMLYYGAADHVIGVAIWEDESCKTNDR